MLHETVASLLQKSDGIDSHSAAAQSIHLKLCMPSAARSLNEMQPLPGARGQPGDLQHWKRGGTKWSPPHKIGPKVPPNGRSGFGKVLQHGSKPFQPSLLGSNGWEQCSFPCKGPQTSLPRCPQHALFDSREQNLLSKHHVPSHHSSKT